MMANATGFPHPLGRTSTTGQASQNAYLNNSSTSIPISAAPAAALAAGTTTIPAAAQSLPPAITTTSTTTLLRSVKWRVSLRLLPDVPVTEQPTVWSKTLRDQRRQYEAERKQRTSNPVTISPSSAPKLDNPLSTEADSSWAQFHRDQELLDTINKDVERLFPTDLGDLFQRADVSDVVRKVLFMWCKANATVSYRQGMHELLAPLVWVLLHDAGLLECASGVPLGVGGETSDVTEASQIRILVADPRFIEHDSHAMFVELMKELVPLYAPSAPPPPPTPAETIDTASAADTRPSGQLQSPVLQLSGQIQYTLLRQWDPVLADRLQQLMIEPQLYALRWTRLLFSREFCHDEVLIVWDALLAMHYRQQQQQMAASAQATTGSNGLLYGVACFAACMLVAIRHELLSSDSNTCLTLLMRYPNTVRVHRIVQLMQHPICEPDRDIPTQSRAAATESRQQMPTRQSASDGTVATPTPTTTREERGTGSNTRVAVPQWLTKTAASSLSSSTSFASSLASSANTIAKTVIGTGTTNQRQSAERKSVPISPHTSNTHVIHSSRSDGQQVRTRMGRRLSSIVSAMEANLASNNYVSTELSNGGGGDVTDKSNGSIDTQKQLLQQLAELKQVRDVLLDRIAENELVWTTSIN